MNSCHAMYVVINKHGEIYGPFAGHAVNRTRHGLTGQERAANRAREKAYAWKQEPHDCDTCTCRVERVRSPQ